MIVTWLGRIAVAIIIAGLLWFIAQGGGFTKGARPIFAPGSSR